jgi:hypothetical protein
VNTEKRSKRFEIRGYYTKELRELVPTLYKDADIGLKGKTFYTKKYPPCEEYVFDVHDVIRRAGRQQTQKSSILLSHMNRPQSGKFKN